MAFKFNGQTLPEYVKVNDIRDSLLPTVSQNTLKVKSRDGLVDYGNEIDARQIEMDITILASDEADLRSKAREFGEWLYTEEAVELEILTEPDVYYKAKITGESTLNEVLNVGQGTITFICTDPFAYGETRTMGIIPTSLNLPTPISNYGGLKSYPKFSFQFTQSVTNFSIRIGNETLSFGKNSNVSHTPVEPNPLRASWDFSSNTGWSASPVALDECPQSQLDTILEAGVSNGWSLSWNKTGYDEGYTGWYGMAGVRDIGYSLQDFKIETTFGLHASEIGELGRVEVYLLDSTNIIIGKQSFRLGNPSNISYWAQARLGSTWLITSADGNGSYGGQYANAWKNWSAGTMAIARRGNEWSVYFGMHDSQGRHVANLHQTYIDTANVHTRKVSKILIHIGSNVYGGDKPVSTAYISDMKIWELNVQPVTVTTDPYVFRSGDILTVDCATAEVRRNGELYYEFLDPNSIFPSLKTGVNGIYVSPMHVTNGYVEYQERWL